jgi:hypothetical protein
VLQLEGNIGSLPKEQIIGFIDTYISAQLPIITEESTEEDRKYHSLVHGHMRHKCYPKSQGGCLKEDGICNRKFGNEIVPESYFDLKGYPVYKRPTQDDCKIVPHNRELLLDWSGHVNVEYAATSYTVLYLYSYLFKGYSKVKCVLNNTDDVSKDDEIKLFIRGRMLCSMDCTWRLFGFQTYPASDPSVMEVDVKSPEQLQFVLSKNQNCHLQVYFERPSHLHALKYTEFYEQYTYRSTNPPAYAERSGSYYINCDNTPRKAYVYKKENTEQIVRMGMIYMTAGDIWYQRLLLRNFPAVSCDDLKTFEGRICSSFQECAILNGLVHDVNEADECFKEALAFSRPSEMRSLLVILTINGFPTLHFLDDGINEMALKRDYYEECACLGMSRKKLLDDLNRRFRDQNKDMVKDYGFPEPPLCDTELQRELVKYNPQEQRELFESLCAQTPFTPEMDELFNEIKALLANEGGKGKLFFIQGQGTHAYLHCIHN